MKRPHAGCAYLLEAASACAGCLYRAAAPYGRRCHTARCVGRRGLRRVVPSAGSSWADRACRASRRPNAVRCCRRPWGWQASTARASFPAHARCDLTDLARDFVAECSVAHSHPSTCKAVSPLVTRCCMPASAAHRDRFSHCRLSYPICRSTFYSRHAGASVIEA